ncbi:hypothetical protein OfM1_19170 [Lactovum odontotermitis]
MIKDIYFTDEALEMLYNLTVHNINDYFFLVKFKGIEYADDKLSKTLPHFVELLDTLKLDYRIHSDARELFDKIDKVNEFYRQYNSYLTNGLPSLEILKDINNQTLHHFSSKFQIPVSPSNPA